nr:hypothetical protein [Photobacterium halotolerans]
MNQFFTLPFGFVVLAALVDIAANMALTRSNGFKHKFWGGLSSNRSPVGN